MRWREHVHRGVRVLETDGFLPGIPTRVEGGKVGFTARGSVIRPPGFELLIPSARVCPAADPDVRAPDGGVSMSVHDDLLCGDTLFSDVWFVQPTA
jgi:hypothetical protein